ncbi:MAG: hypothetical protein MJ252_15050, partial [archaeon]|nr:hypothetical protein [archaeon]
MKKYFIILLLISLSFSKKLNGIIQKQDNSTAANGDISISVQEVQALFQFLGFSDVIFSIYCNKTVEDFSYYKNIIISYGVTYDLGYGGMDNDSCRFTSENKNYIYANVSRGNPGKTAVMLFWHYPESITDNTTIIYTHFVYNDTEKGIIDKYNRIFYVYKDGNYYLGTEFISGNETYSV